MSDMYCPHCGAAENLKNRGGLFACGSNFGPYQTELCREREAHNKTKRERDEAREERDHWKTEYEIVEARLCGKKHPRDNGIFSEHEIIPKLERERDEAIAERKASAADWLKQIEQANARVSRALQQFALAERERDEAREMQAKALRERESTEREVEAMLERAIKAERERDAARAELEMWRDGNILHEIHRDELEEAKRNAGIRVTDKIPNENNHPNYGGTSLL